MYDNYGSYTTSTTTDNHYIIYDHNTDNGSTVYPRKYEGAWLDESSDWIALDEEVEHISFLDIP